MEKFRNKRIMTIALLVVGVLGLSLGFAAFSSQLQIKSSLTVKPDESTFSVVFSKEANELNTDPVIAEKNLTTFSAEGGKIVNGTNPTISNLKVDFTAPGQTAVYKFYAMNTGKYTAYLNSIVFGATVSADGSRDAKVCTPGFGANASMVAAACEDITISVQVEGMDAITASQTGITDHPLAIGASELITVTISYAENGALADGPFEVEFPDVYLVYSSISSNDVTPEASGYAAQIGDQYYATVEEAINNAPDGAIIDVIADTTVGAITIDKTLTLMSSNESTMYFTGASGRGSIDINGHLVIGDGDPSHNLTIKGVNQGNTTTTSRLIAISSGSLTLNAGATIGYNSFKNASNQGKGGCIAAYAGTQFIMTGGTITNCSAAEDGGAIYMLANTQANITGGQILNSHANHGGGIFVSQVSTVNASNLTVSNCSSSGRYTESNGGAAGGGIYTSGILTLTNSTITNNKTEGKGGGVYVGATHYASANITNSNITNNSAGPDDDGNGKDGQGGGIYVGAVDDANYSTLEILDSTVNGNISSRNGADIHVHLNFYEDLNVLQLKGTNNIGTIYYLQ